MNTLSQTTGYLVCTHNLRLAKCYSNGSRMSALAAFHFRQFLGVLQVLLGQIFCGMFSIGWPVSQAAVKGMLRL